MTASNEVLMFCDAFTKLLSYINDDRDVLIRSYHEDLRLRQLADEVAHCAFTFEIDELLNKEFVISLVEPKFARLWRKYEEEFLDLFFWYCN